MSKKIRAASFAMTLIFIITGFLSWRFDQIAARNVSGWNFLIHEPLTFMAVIILLAGSISFIFLHHKRYGFFTVMIGCACLFLFYSEMSLTLRLTQETFAQLYQIGFLVSAFVIKLIIILTVIQLALKQGEE